MIFIIVKHPRQIEAKPNLLFTSIVKHFTFKVAFRIPNSGKMFAKVRTSDILVNEINLNSYLSM